MTEIRPQRLDLESRLEEWIERDISLLGEKLLTIGHQVSTAFGGRIDLLCLDRDANLVVVELKRDRTPREATAQILDYASWVVDLSRDQVDDIANEYLAERGPMEDAFQKLFQEELPEIVNERHRLLLVASETDSSSERIIQYLSDHHGVSINLVTFQYFQSEGREILARAFLVEPDLVEYRAKTRSGSKRQPNLTRRELEEIAEQHEVGVLYRSVVSIFDALFDGNRTTRSSIGFVGARESGRGVMFNLIPGESSAENGVRYQAYSFRIAEFFDVSESRVKDLLPANAEPWQYVNSGDPSLSGYTGFLRSVEEAERFAQVLRASTVSREKGNLSQSGPR